MKLYTFLLSALACAASYAQERPNIVFIITDDQGYGDIKHHGHPYVITPSIDKLAKESVSLENYHVFPTCSPSRAAIMTGRWANRTGVWHTIMGRSLLRKSEVTIATMLNKAGYNTGMFGKWHMGDTYPFRPEDRGFTEVYRHGGGGVGQTPDVWDNSYFDGGYYHNGKIVKAKGFCTDVFFEQANKFISSSVKEKKPFFAYISTNAPHGPLLCPQSYQDMYKGKPHAAACFYGMITNIDDNVGKTRKLLKELGADKNTVFIYTTDNGTAYGKKVYNAGMRGGKGSEYDGGHRVPMFIHWPAGGLMSERKVKTLTHAVDVAPTLLDYCGVKRANGVKFDGISIRKLVDKGDGIEWADRMLITDSQRVVYPIKWRKSAVMSQKWRLVNGKELYDMEVDPGQKKNVAAENPDQVIKMRQFYDAWWAELEPGFKESAESIIGHEKAKKVTLTCHDWIDPKMPPWNQSGVRSLTRYVRDEFEGYWAIDVVKADRYKVVVSRWPVDSGIACDAPIAAGATVPGSSKPYRATPGKQLDIKSVVVMVDGKEVARKAYKAGSKGTALELDFKKGKQQLILKYELADGKQVGAAYGVISSR